MQGKRFAASLPEHCDIFFSSGTVQSTKKADKKRVLTGPSRML